MNAVAGILMFLFPVAAAGLAQGIGAALAVVLVLLLLGLLFGILRGASRGAAKGAFGFGKVMHEVMESADTHPKAIGAVFLMVAGFLGCLAIWFIFELLVRP